MADRAAAQKASALTRSPPHRTPSAPGVLTPTARAGAGTSLQRHVGNAGAVALASRLTQTTNHSVAAISPVGELPKDKTVIQAKLTISRPDDPFEKEAESVADKVMRMPDPTSASRTNVPDHTKTSVRSVQRLCASCDEELSKSADTAKSASIGSVGYVQRVESSASAPQATPSIEANIHAMQGGGSPLPAATRAFFEPRFGADFGNVRVHTGGRADATAKSINAMAFTIGTDIVFGGGQYSPESRAGENLLAHELTHVIQQTSPAAGPKGSIAQRKPDGEVSDAGPADAGDVGQTRQYNDVTLNTDPIYTYELLKRIAIANGQEAARTFVTSFRLDIVVPHTPLAGPIDDPELIRDQSILATLETQLQKLDEEHNKFLRGFESQAGENAESILTANEEQAKSEGIRYGLTSEQIEKIVTRRGAGGEPVDVHQYETKYSMDRESPAGRGLQDAATVLLGRRQAIEKRRQERSTHLRLSRDPYDPKGRIWVADEQYQTIGNEINEMETAYNNLRTFLSSQYPILASFSNLNENASELERISKKGPGPDVAALVGQEIANKLMNIEKVRAGLKDGDVNFWRQPKLVELTALQLGATDDPLKQRWTNDKVATEQPGVLAELALLVLNIAALLLAGPTGGASLVVAAGVNVIATAAHVQEYLMQSALSGTAFDKAQAISAEDPSLFWLALEIVGTGLDVGAAAAVVFRGFKKLAPLVKAAQVATEGEEAVKSMQAVQDAAKELKDATFAEKIVAQVENLRKGKAAVVEGARITGDELDLLQKAGKFAEEVSASRIGKEIKTASGEINLSKSGHIFSCSSPCAELGDKYSKIFAKERGFYDEFVKLQKRARDVAQMEKAAKDGNALSRVQAIADQIKKDAAALESRIQRANPHLLSVDGLEKLLELDEFAKGTPKGNELRFIWYQKKKGGGALPFDEWQRRATRIWENSSKGTLTEQELQEAMDLGLKNTQSMVDKTGTKSFIPDHVEGLPDRLEWGKPYHFKEIKDWQNMSDTGNLKAMLDYVEKVPGSRITLYFRSNTKMTGPLTTKIEALLKAGKAELVPFAGR